MAQAAPVSQVYAVVSSLHDVENLKPNARSTNYAHGGDIIIVTVEIGYGNSGTARLNGNTMKLDRDPQPISNNRNEVIGFLKYWRSHLNGSGYFTYEVTSIVHPFNTMSTRLSIKSP